MEEKIKLSKFIEQYAQGFNAEERFMKLLGNPSKADRNQNIKEHWDVKGVLSQVDDTEKTFDVKMMKKINRSDNYVQDNITWIEIKNVSGNPGWINGKADYIAFERVDCWLVVDRKQLNNFVSDKLANKTVSGKKGIYERYQRYGRQDEITQVPFDDIINLDKSYVVKKNTDENN